MSPSPTPTPVRRAVSPLDHRIEAATGHDIDTLWAYRDRGVLDEPHAHLVDRHRALAKAQTGVVFYLKLLNRLSSGEFESMTPCSRASTARWTSWRRPPTPATPLPGR